MPPSPRPSLAQQALRLRDAGRGPREIARALDITPSQARDLTATARAQRRSALSRREPNERAHGSLTPCHSSFSFPPCRCPRKAHAGPNSDGVCLICGPPMTIYEVHSPTDPSPLIFARRPQRPPHVSPLDWYLYPSDVGCAAFTPPSPPPPPRPSPRLVTRAWQLGVYTHDSYREYVPTHARAGAPLVPTPRLVTRVRRAARRAAAAKRRAEQAAKGLPQ